MIDALVLAGSPNNGQLKNCSGVEYEALIPIGKKTMVEYVVAALAESKNINRIVIVGPKILATVFKSLPIKIVEPQEKIMQNLHIGFEQLAGSKRVLVTTSDIPLITAKAIDDFVNHCGDQGSDLYFPIVPKKLVVKRFPAVKRTYVTLKDGIYTGGNVFLANPAIVSKCLEKGQAFIDVRKSPIKLCKMLGLSFLFKFLIHQLTVREIEKKASVLLGIKGQAVICSNPEIGVDVDKPSDLNIAINNLDITKD